MKNYEKIPPQFFLLTFDYHFLQQSSDVYGIAPQKVFHYKNEILLISIISQPFYQKYICKMSSSV